MSSFRSSGFTECFPLHFEGPQQPLQATNLLPGFVPKKTQDEFHLIPHLSFPKGSSLNDSISSDHTSVSYATIEDAIQFIRTVGTGCFLAKI